MRLRNFYIQESSNKPTNMAFQLLKSKSFKAIGMFCMLTALFLSKPASAQTVSRTSTVIAGSSPFQDSLWTFTTPGYEVLKRLSPTLSGFTITGINGLATDPISGEHYCILKLSGVTGRVLGTINIQTGVCAQIGNLGDNFATLAFNANGTLFGVTGGNAAIVPETMYRINKTDASTTLFRTLGNGADGETILFNPDDNKFYHWSGNGTVVWERFDTTGTDLIEDLTYSGTPGGETFGAYYLGGNDILVSNISSTFRIWSISGATGTIGASVASLPDDIRGMVSESHSSSISAGSSTAICNGGNVVLTVSGGTGGYQWYINGSSIGGANSSSYVATAEGIYNCIYADINGIIDSPALGISVSFLTNPSISLVAHPQVCFGATTTGISYTTNINYSFTGSSNTYHVPSGVTSINFDLMGGVGGNDTGMAPNPGKGGRIQGTLAVTPGDVITVNTGGAGSMGAMTGAMGGFNGGGNSFGYGGSGGGATDIRLNGNSLSDRVAIAGGGGGSGHTGFAFSVAGGNGGNTVAADGEFNADGFNAIGGDAATGGAGATFTGFLPGADGSLAMGGDGSMDGVSGGGGGGLYGGGGGAWSGGAGGSSYGDAILVTGTTHTQGANATNGSANLSFTIPSAYTYSIVWDAGAITAGFTDVSSLPFPVSTFPIDIPSTAGPDTYTGTLIMSDGSCTYSEPISVWVKPIPDVNATGDQTLCNGEGTTDVNFSGTLGGTNFDWTNDLSTVGIAAVGTGDILSFMAINATTTAQTAEIVVTPELNGCFGATDTFTYTVKPTPTLSSPASAGYVCDNAPFNYTATSGVFGTSFLWSRDAMTGDIVAGANSGTTTISETFDNSGTAPVAVAYTFTLTANGCESNPVVTMTVNPTPTLLPELIGTVCSGGTVTFTQASATLGLVHSWSRDTVNGIAPGATSGTGLVSEVITNLTPNPITITYIDTLNINGCRYTENLSVIVNPMPVLTSGMTHNICDNDTFNYTATTATAGTTITWERFPVTGISSPYATGPDTVSEMHDNTTISPITVTYIFSLSANGCPNTQNVSVVVNPTPALSTTLTPANICDSAFFDYIPASNTPGVTFNWTRANVANITNPSASGIGNPHERLRNSATYGVAVTYVFTTSINGCSNAENVVVTVNPRPRLSNTPPVPICDNTVFTFSPTSATLGYSYLWTREFVPGIGALPVFDATGNINELMKNNTNTNIVVKYAFKISANGCDRFDTMRLVVHPTPKLSSHLTDSACSGAPYTYVPRPLTIPALKYKWSRAMVSNITPLTASGVDNINETLINATANTLNVTYVYTLTVGESCTNTENLLVRVRPSAEVPVIGVMPPSSLCNGTMYQNFGATVPAPTGVSYIWSAENAEVFATGTGKQYSIVNFNTPGTAVVKLSSTIGATGCVGVASYTVNVSNNSIAMPSVIFTRGKFICLQNDNIKSYQWGYDDANTLDSVLLKGEINQSYFNATPETTARHFWVMTTSGDCTQKAYYNRPNDNTPRLIENNEDGISEIKVFPNPANDKINVEVFSLEQGNVEVELLNMLGQVISKVNADNNKASINVANLPGGFYMIDCYKGGIKIGTAKFVKN